jgi:hypothetical protein
VIREEASLIRSKDEKKIFGSEASVNKYEMNMRSEMCRLCFRVPIYK